jgi:CubicO group peptidase (beta-lactamase class C family)
VLALQLAERGKLALDEPVARYVADLPELLQPLTLRRLLSHTAGVRHYRADRTDNGTAQRTTREALALFSSDPLIAEPGTKYSYSTHAFTLVAAALEGAAERDFRALLRENLSAKCAPTLDCEVASEVKPARSALYERLALGLVRRSEPREDLSWKYAGGGLESSAADLARFADAVLRARVVSEPSRDALWSREELADGTSIDYGLGWGVGDKGRIVSHTGSQQGSSTSLSVHRERGVVIAILCNTTGAGAADLAPRLRQLVLDAR